jgi:glycosyltransferase involved in cell wall biosynthesis
MNILAVYRHYDCDTAIRHCAVRALIEQQAAAGHTMTVFAAQTSPDHDRPPRLPRRETIPAVCVRRTRLLRKKTHWRIVRAVNVLWFLSLALIHVAVTKKYDLIIATNHQPLVMGCVLRAIRALRGIPYIYLCPELRDSACINGDLVRSRLYDGMRRWDTATCIAARRTVVPSQDMAETLIARGVPRERISAIAGFATAEMPTDRQTSSPSANERPDSVRFLYVGELSRHYGLERLIAAAKLVAGRLPFQLFFMGEGNARNELVELAGDLLGRRIKFVPPQSMQTTFEAIRVCHYGIVSLAADSHRHRYPFEANYFANAGCPIIALVEPQCELARSIEQHESGYVAASRSVTGIADTIVKAVVERDRWTPQRRLLLQASSRAHFGQAEIHAKWDEFIAGDVPAPLANRHHSRTSRAA